MSEDFEIVNPQEAQLDTLLQILAVLIDRLNGEVVISRAEFEAYEGVPVVGCSIARDYVRFRLALEDEDALVEETEFPEDKPQT